VAVFIIILIIKILAMRKKSNKKLFIIDTNVLLHDYKCIYNFEENDVIIPIVVLEELDKFKRGNDLINFHAREFTRELDKLSGDMLLTANIPLGENLGNLHIETGRDFSEKVNQSFPERTADHRILAIADYVCTTNKDTNVVLITKDINLRMKAKSLGITAQDYQNDKVANIDDLYKGIQVLDGVNQVGKTLNGEILTLHRDQNCVRASQSINCQQIQCWRAIDQNEIVFLGSLFKSDLEPILALFLLD